MNYKIVLTKDGSNTLFCAKFNEHYHSLHGAITESLHVYINTGFKNVEKEDVSILEIGCNDGVFLENFKNSTHLGVEPSKNVFKLSKKRKLNVDNSFFNYEYTNRIKKKYDKFNVVFGSNVICHIPDQQELYECINQVLSKLAPAFAAGCTVVLKPSEITPGAAQIFAEVVDKTSMPKGMFNLIHGYGAVVGKAMSAHEGLEMISFTGSTRAGIDIQKTAAENIKRISLELGGKSPNIILDDVDIGEAVSMGMKQCFFNTGQSCSSPTRMLVPENMIDEATKHAVSSAEAMITGDPMSEDIFLGPISNKTQFLKVQDLIQKGLDEGAKLACGGIGRPEGLSKGYFVKPTVFTNVDNSMSIAQEEIFGPVICLIPYKDIDHAIQIANDTPYGLSSMISCSDEKKGHSIAKKIRAGQVIVNRPSRGEYPAPFGGFKMSGNGREHGVFGIEEYLEVQAVIN